MSKIEEIIIEPGKVEVGSTFKLKVRISEQEGVQNEEQDRKK